MNTTDLGQNDLKIIDRVQVAGQSHVFKFWDDLKPESKRKLLKQLDSIDFALLARLFQEHIQGSQPMKSEGTFEPADFYTIPRTATELEERQELRRLGEKTLREGRVSAFLVAGGQGTRLGYDGPKGAFPISAIARKSLFQIHAEKLLALRKKYEAVIPWCIMTSEANHQATCGFFHEHDHFGLDPSSVRFFTQEMIPAIDRRGRLLLEAKDYVFTNPNGHGGSLSALKKSGTIDALKATGIDLIFFFQVDNVLTKICDPCFIGLHVREEAEMSAKVIRKKDPEEKVGVIGRINGQYSVIEYSDFTRAQKHARNSDGSLKFSAGSIATHLFNLDFIERENRQGLQLPFHIAHKRIPYLDDNGALVKPKQPNGYKFETFVFDALKDTKRVAVMEVDRSEEFSPLKNAEGDNSPETVHRAMSNLFGSWLHRTGIAIPRDAENNVVGDIEISPLFAIEESDLDGKLQPGLKFNGKLYLG
ncbi:UDPGP type 1 family protein [bacterium]|nr:UDPGP type 1 family protein [bacterium]